MDDMILQESSGSLEGPSLRGSLTDDIAEEDLHEVMYGGSWVVTDPDIWRSWTGERMLNGELYHGPVYNLGTESLYTGVRSCGCRVCEQHMESTLKMN